MWFYSHSLSSMHYENKNNNKNICFISCTYTNAVEELQQNRGMIFQTCESFFTYFFSN